MKIIPAEQCDFSLLCDFIKPFEYACVALAADLRRKSKNLYMICREVSCVRNDNVSDGYDGKIAAAPSEIKKCGNVKNILGVFKLDKTLLHCIPFLSSVMSGDVDDADTDGLKNEFARIFSDFVKDKHIKCIDGEREATEYFLEILKNQGQIPYQENHYRLMISGTISAPPEKLSEDDEIRRCGPESFEQLYALQKKYLVEEVVPFGKKASDAEVSISLRLILKNQLCVAVFYDDEAVAKANTNAIGLNWIQIGGVYTHPRFRRNYYAQHLVYFLCRRIEHAGKRAALFVKDINVPAIELYKKTGFKDAGLFEIAYFS